MNYDWIVVGDLHADNNNIEKVDTLFDILEEIGKSVFFTGDFFDTKEIIHGKIFNRCRKRLKESKLEFVIDTGNHDYFNLDCLEHSLEALKDLPNVTIVDQPMLINGLGTVMPYYDDLDKFKRDLKWIGKNDVNTLFIHQGVIGFDYGNGHVADGLGHGELDFDELKSFDRVISGHFHKFAQKGNLTFIGTPFTQDHGETNQIKYIAEFDAKKNALAFVETPFPGHKTLEVDLSETNPETRLEDKMNTKDIYRIKLIGTEMQIAAFDKAVFPNATFLDEPTDADQVENANIKDTDSNEQKFLIWAKEIKGLDDTTIAKGLEILKAS